MSPQIGGLGPKYQDIVISFRLREGENLTKFYLRALHIRCEFLLFQDQTGQNQQPHRQIHHGTVKIETYSKIHNSILTRLQKV